MVIACPRCAARLNIPEKAVKKPEKKVLCPGCRQVFLMKEGVQSVAKPPPVAAVAPPATSEFGGEGLELHTAPDSFLPSEEAPPTAPTGPRFEVDRTDYKNSDFDIEELRDLIKRGWISKADRIRQVDSEQWTVASKAPSLKKAFEFRQREIAGKLQSMARKSTHACANHARKKATHICLECAHAFCRDCGNDELGATPLCLECDAEMSPIH